MLQYLMMAFLSEGLSSSSGGGGKGEEGGGILRPIGESGVDFRAACFCHRRVVERGWVCSVCLSSMFHHSNTETLSYHVPYYSLFPLLRSFSPSQVFQSYIIQILMRLLESSFLLSAFRRHLPHLRHATQNWQLWPKTRRGGTKEEETEESIGRCEWRRYWQWCWHAGPLKQPVYNASSRYRVIEWIMHQCPRRDKSVQVDRDNSIGVSYRNSSCPLSTTPKGITLMHTASYD